MGAENLEGRSEAKQTRWRSGRGSSNATGREAIAAVRVWGATLRARLAVPPGAGAVVVVAHGPEARDAAQADALARRLRADGLATFAVDVHAGGEGVLGVGRAAERVVAAADHVGRDAATEGLPVVLVGLPGVEAAVLRAAAENPRRFRATVAVGPAPDRAGRSLGWVRTPTLFVASASEANAAGEPVVPPPVAEALAAIRGPRRAVALPVVDGGRPLGERTDELGAALSVWLEPLTAAPVPRAS